MTQNLEKLMTAIGKSSWGFGVRVRGRGQANKAEADKFAEKMRPILLEVALKAGNSRKSVVIARMLNERGIPTARGGDWHPETVKRLLRRLQPEFDQELSHLKKGQSAAFFSECGVTPSALAKGSAK